MNIFIWLDKFFVYSHEVRIAYLQTSSAKENGASHRIFLRVQPIESLRNPDNFLKVVLCGTFKKLSEFYVGARRCMRVGSRQDEHRYRVTMRSKFLRGSRSKNGR